MNIILIVVDYQRIVQPGFEASLKKKVGKPCFVFHNTWAIQTDHKAKDVSEFVRSELGSDAKYIVAQTNGSWLAQNAPTLSKCFG